MRSSSARPRSLLLVGGGHAHLAVLEMFARHPRQDVALTLVSAEAAAFYSGMVPGVIAGHYEAREAQIPLEPLARAAGAAFVHDKVTGLSLDEKLAFRRNGEPVAFDLLSLDIGSTPTEFQIEASASTLIPVKPVEKLLVAWESALARATQGAALQLVTIGGGLGGIELTLAMAQRLQASNVSLCIVTRDAVLAPAASPRARALMCAALAEKNIALVAGFEATRLSNGNLHAADGRSVAADFMVLASHAAAAPWIAVSGLAVDGRGFVAVDETLRSLSHPFVFAVGDTASFGPRALPKSGVVAVRQGETLAHNLWSLLDGAPLSAYRPQRDWLALLGTGGKQAIATRGRFAARSLWFWRWKQAIDRRFVDRHLR